MQARICAATLAVLLASSGMLQAQEQPEGYKDPKTATEWGYLLPGAGHIYAGESTKGWLLMGASVGALIGGITMTLNSGDDSELSAAEASFGEQDFGAVGTSSSSTVKAEETDMVPAYVGIGVFGAGWIYSVVDAPKAAERTNRKNGLSGLLPGRVTPYVTVRGGSTQYGLRLEIEL